MTHTSIHPCNFCGNPLSVAPLSDHSDVLMATCFTAGCPAVNITMTPESHAQLTIEDLSAFAIPSSATPITDTPDLNLHVDSFARAILKHADNDVIEALSIYGQSLAEGRTPDMQTSVRFYHALTEANKRNVLVGYRDIADALLRTHQLDAFEDAIALQVYRSSTSYTGQTSF